ncbi:MAG: hypothetical protein ACREJ2_17280 [Planctomycetota bacterium]
MTSAPTATAATVSAATPVVGSVPVPAAVIAAAAQRLEFLRAQMPKAPPLPLPSGPDCRHVPVATAAELAAAIRDAQPGDVILLADGVYAMPRGVTVLVDRVQIRGASCDPAQVILDGSAEFMEVNAALIMVKRSRRVTFAHLTFRNSRKYGLLFYGDAAVRYLHLYNCRFHNIWARGLKGTGAQMPEDNPANGRNAADVIEAIRPRQGRVEYCEFTADHIKTDLGDGFGGDYIAGMDMMHLDGWTVTRSLFFNLRGARGGGRGGIFIWVQSRDLTIERNLFVDCDRSIALGNPSQVAHFNVDGATVRDNVIVNGAGHAMECLATRDVCVFDNRIYATQLGMATVEWKYGAVGGCFERNLVRGRLDFESTVTPRDCTIDPAPIAAASLAANADLAALIRPVPQ